MSLFNRSLCVYVFALLILAQSFSPLSLSSQAKTVAADSKLLEPASVCDDAIWANGFGRAGVDGVVKAVATSANDVYVAGGFSQAGNKNAAQVAKWNGERWSSLGDGLPVGFNTIKAIAVIGNNVYVGGLMSSSDPAKASAIARWNGASWSFLPHSSAALSSNDIYGLATIGNDLYAVGGLFFGASMNITVEPVLKWDGSNWSKLGNDVEGNARAIAVSGTDVYIGGFLDIGEPSANKIAKWNGATWSTLGGDLGTSIASVRAIAASGSDVYVGGSLTTAGGMSVNNIARWNGASWSALGSGENNGVNGAVQALGIIGNDLYVGGGFSVAGGLLGSGGILATNIAKWNGASWSTLGSGEANGVSTGQFTSVHGIAVSGSSIFIAGDFTKAAGQDAYYVVKWSNGFSELGGEILNGLNGDVYAIAVLGDDVYVGGTFTTAGGMIVNHIARWDGFAWWPLGAGPTKGVNGDVLALVVSGNDLYVGGAFNMAGENIAVGIAKWDGSNWSAFNNGSGFGVDGGVHGIAVVGSDVYVGGFFASASGVSAKNIAKWNGTNWSALGSGITDILFGQGTVYSVKAIGTDVYAGGNFDRAGGLPANGIARWDGANWHPLGSGVSGSGIPGQVYAMDVTGSDLYVGGTFENAGGMAANFIAMWDGDNWSTLGSGSNNGIGGIVHSINADKSGVYVGGNLTVAGGVSVSGIARWGGATWKAYGSGAVGTVRAIGVAEDNLYVGGTFDTAGMKPSYHFAAWDGSSLLSAVSHPFNVSGGGSSVVVTIPAGCVWDAKSNEEWIVLTSPAFNTGSDTVTYEVRENFNSQPRSGIMTLAGQPFTVRQAGTGAQSCSTTISPGSAAFTASGGSSTINVATSSGCLWVANSNVSWITITADPSGIGAGSVRYRVSPNNTGSSRAGKITVGGRSFSVKQKGA